MEPHSQRPTPGLDDRALLDGSRRAAALLDAALAMRPQELGEEVDIAERAVVRLRDGLIERLRAADAAEDSAGARAALATINATLSLIVGVEYSQSGVQRGLLEQARDALRALAGDR